MDIRNEGKNKCVSGWQKRREEYKNEQSRKQRKEDWVKKEIGIARIRKQSELY